jgi:hypothetical protein
MATPSESLLCPITLELFRDPVLAQDGHTYEKEAIEDWIRKNGTSPKTGQQLSIEHLSPNHIVKQLVANRIAQESPANTAVPSQNNAVIKVIFLSNSEIHSVLGNSYAPILKLFLQLQRLVF